eukprot:TRINITY_DN55446_c0_g1_i1.p1 TRINITY_DN55446_c0_g1~~TRINITY_DN55446_c0_g1_i1.p1  ORF type:complete len:577 (-),score=105.90 TRINITY_DN55446_c0_g1_i1:396-2024(-)
MAAVASQVSPGAGASVTAGSSIRPNASSSKNHRCSNAQMFIEEMKAKQATLEALKQERVKLAQQIDELAGKDSRWWPERSKLQQRLAMVEQSVRLLGGDRSLIDGSTPAPAHPGLAEQMQVDPLNRLCNAFATFLRTCESKTCLLSTALLQFKAQKTWTELVQSGIVDKNLDVKQVFLKRSDLFRVSVDAKGSSSVHLVGEVGAAPPLRALMPVSMTPPMQVSAATVSDSVALPAIAFGSRTDPLELERAEVLRGLEENMKALTTSRGAIRNAMGFCLEHAPRHAAVVAKRLIWALEAPDLDTDTVVARLFLVSDVLHNSGGGRVQGATQYRASFQELLPGAFEQLGRQWLSSLGKDLCTERRRAETAARRVLRAWRSWSVFPALFIGGLEMLLFAPVVMESARDDEDTHEELRDKVLQQKLARWRKASDMSQLPKAAHQRGLAGTCQAVADCVRLLCRYERYWHRPVPSETSCSELEDNIDGESLAGSDDFGEDAANVADCLEFVVPAPQLCQAGRTLGCGLEFMPKRLRTDDGQILDEVD